MPARDPSLCVCVYMWTARILHNFFFFQLKKSLFFFFLYIQWCTYIGKTPIFCCCCIKSTKGIFYLFFFNINKYLSLISCCGVMYTAKGMQAVSRYAIRDRWLIYKIKTRVNLIPRNSRARRRVVIPRAKERVCSCSSSSVCDAFIHVRTSRN